MNEFVINIYLFSLVFLFRLRLMNNFWRKNGCDKHVLNETCDKHDRLGSFFFFKFWEKYFDYSPPTITIRWFDALRSFQLRREYVADNAINWISIDSSSVILIKRKVSLLMNWKKIIKKISKWITRFHQTNLFILLTI